MDSSADYRKARFVFAATFRLVSGIKYAASAKGDTETQESALRWLKPRGFQRKELAPKKRVVESNFAKLSNIFYY